MYLPRLMLLGWFASALFLHAGEPKPSSFERERMEAVIVGAGKPERFKNTIARLAGDASRCESAIAIAVYAGTLDKVSEKRVADGLSGKIEKEYGYKTVTFTKKEPELKYTRVFYFVDGLPYGPFDVRKAIKEIADVAGRYRARYLKDIWEAAAQERAGR